MSTPKHTRKSATHHVTARLRTILCTCLSAMLAFTLGLGIYGTQLKAASVRETPFAQPAAPSEADDLASATESADASSEGTFASEAGSVDSSTQYERGESYANAPEDSYVSNTVLVSISSDDDIASAREAIERLSDAGDASIDKRDSSYGFITVSYNGDASSGQIADQLVAQGIDAQPNFLYYALGTDGKEVVDAPDEEVRESGMQQLSSSTATESAESALTAQSSTINDDRAVFQWGLDAVDAYDAWDLAKCRDDDEAAPRVCVAIIDSGCKVDHPDLERNIVGTFDTRSDNGIVTDEQNHGTHVAGIIAAEANNGIGVAGVSYNAGLYIVRALHKENGEFVAPTSDIVKAYQNIVKNKTVNASKNERIRVINMSLGSKRGGNLGEGDRAIMREIENAYLNHDILTISAAGNRDGSLPYHCFPCDFSDNMIGVINLQESPFGLYRNYDSNFNNPGEYTKQLSAPGTQILSTSNSPANTYVFKDGTSMASPMVAGVAALTFASNPTLSAASVKNILCNSATDLYEPGFDVNTGYGCVNALRAVEHATEHGFITGSDSVLKGKTITLSCPLASNWSSSNQSVASVSADGVVKGVSAGYTTISVRADGQTLQKTVAVYDPEISGASSLTAGDSETYAIDATMPGSWSFELGTNTAGARISKDGLLTTSRSGTVKVIAKLDSNPSISAQKAVTVKAKAAATSSGAASSSTSSGGSSQNTTKPGTSAPSTTTATKQTMYRLYNPNSGEHFYTASSYERDQTVKAGWKYEGIGWTAPKKSNTPVYRLYNPNAGDHHYTTSSVERVSLIKAGWKNEGIGWYSDDGKTKPLYREYNPNAKTGTHNYTTSSAEHKSLVSIGWRNEGIGWYGL